MLPLTKLQKYIQNNIKYYLFQIKEENGIKSYIDYKINPSYIYEVVFDNLHIFAYYPNQRNLLFVGKSHIIITYNQHNDITDVCYIRYPYTTIFKIQIDVVYRLDYIYEDPIKGLVMREYNSDSYFYRYRYPNEEYPFGGNKFAKNTSLIQQLQLNSYTKKLNHAIYLLKQYMRNNEYLYVAFDENLNIIVIILGNSELPYCDLRAYVKDEIYLHCIDYHTKSFATFMRLNF
jgi:hypothetical protein